jgi:hypothetical protein
MNIFYHVFDWEQDRDEYFETYEEAEKYYNDLKKDGCENLRLYEIIEEPEDCFEEDCIRYYNKYDDLDLNTED